MKLRTPQHPVSTNSMIVYGVPKPATSVQPGAPQATLGQSAQTPYLLYRHEPTTMAPHLADTVRMHPACQAVSGSGRSACETPKENKRIIGRIIKHKEDKPLSVPASPMAEIKLEKSESNIPKEK